MLIKEELIDEKLDNDYIFSLKNKIHAKIYRQILVMFYYITLIRINEKFFMESQSDCKNFKYLPISSFL